MIRLSKIAGAPQWLQRGVAPTAADCRRFERNPFVYQSAAASFSFNSGIYGHRSVKSTLADLQHKKCCYCENRFSASAPGDVEHFRPKQCVQQTKGSETEYPGYYWLAYTWSNLFFSCETCNRAGKRNLFPLANSRLRARHHFDNVQRERPLLIDPTIDDPRQFIRFRQDLAYGLSRRGWVTIDVLNLNRSELQEERLEHARLLLILRKMVRRFERTARATDPVPADVSEARAHLAAAQTPAARFSSMAIDLLA